MESILEPENILSACGLMLGRFDQKIAVAEAGVSPGIDPGTLHPLVGLGSPPVAG